MTAGSLTYEETWRVLVDTIERLPDTELLERQDWVQLRTPSSAFATHNRILRARIEDARVSAVIAEVIRDHRERGAGLSWVVDEGSSPADLSERLVAAGFRVNGRARGMVLPVPTGPAPSLPRGVRIEAAERKDAHRLGQLRLDAWPAPPEHGRAHAQWIERIFDRGARHIEHTLAFLDDELVGSAVLHMRPGLGYLQGGWVLPRARGRGIYTALTHARLARLHAHAIPHAVIWADAATSGPIAERLGFTEVGWAVFHELRGASA